MRVLIGWNGPANASERTILARREVHLLERLATQDVEPTVVLFGDPAGSSDDLRRAG
jgi:hypothetical protein